MMEKAKLLNVLGRYDMGAADAVAEWTKEDDEFTLIADSPTSCFVVAKLMDTCRQMVGTKPVGTSMYDLLYVFRMGLPGSTWAVSADVQRKDADAVFAAMQRRMIGDFKGE